jgi:hypothetical protein
MIYRSLLLLALAPIVLSAPPVPKDESAEKLKRDYGEWSDPDKDCKFAFKEDKLQISLPAAWHLQWPHRWALRTTHLVRCASWWGTSQQSSA